MPESHEQALQRISDQRAENLAKAHETIDRLNQYISTLIVHFCPEDMGIDEFREWVEVNLFKRG